MILRKRHSMHVPTGFIVVMVTAASASSRVRADDFAAPLPSGVAAVWDLSKAHHETTPTGERICLNGLWRWQPALDGAQKPQPPSGSWGYFKVPGCWPGISDYIQKDARRSSGIQPGRTSVWAG
jgi:hypothetical protein